ncbi:MAG TPA: CpaF family protein [Bacilli bacterium]
MKGDVIHNLKRQIRDQIDMFIAISNEDLRVKIEEVVFAYANRQPMTANEKYSTVQTIYNSFRGLDVLQPLIDDRSITEIMINHHCEIFIEREGKVMLCPVQFESKEKLEDIIQTVVSKVNRVVNESSPIVDARLKDGSRVNVVLPPVALKGPAMTIRKFPDKPMTMDDLVHRGTLSADVADVLEYIVQAKYNIFISGGTGSGKTTFLNALSNFIPEDERIITIEDSAELQIHKVPNLVSLETRNSNTEGRGEISVRDLIKSSLRMRPNRIIVGEVRGAEALDMLQAMNTGHDGSLSTGHGNSIPDMLSRLETMVLSGANLPLQVIRQQIGSAIDIMIHLSRMRDHSRKVTEISEIIGVHDGEIKVNPLYRYQSESEGCVATGNEMMKVKGCT